MPILEVRDLKKYFKNTKAVDGISLEIARGEFVALLGPNGAGKTTLVEMIEGIQKPDSGEVLINGRSWKGNEQQHHQVLGISLQETRFIEKLTTLETLNLFNSFYGLSNKRSNEILELVGLSKKRKSYVKYLSGGQRQKLALGIALLNNPQLLLLDEPTTGLDPSARREIWDILKKLQKEHDTSMILTTHYMEEASYLCDRIIIVDNGKVLAKGTLQELLSEHKKGEIIDFTVNKPLDKAVLPKNENIIDIEIDENGLSGLIIVEDLIHYLPDFLQHIEKESYVLTSLECRKMTLDDLFISMTGRHLTT